MATKNELSAVRIAWVLGLAFLANLILAPVLGTALVGVLSGQPLFLFMADLAGAPVVVYGLISTLAPAFVLTMIGHFELSVLLFSPLRRSRSRWLAGGCVLGAISGLGAVAWIGALEDYSLIGTLVGGACGTMQAALWWRGICSRLTVSSVS